MQIEELLTLERRDVENLRSLMGQLSERIVLQEERLLRIVEDGNTHLYVVRDGDGIIGCATLCVYDAPSGRKAMVEDVVVHEDCRGLHIGRRLMEHVMEQARLLAPVEVHLTSNPRRVAANGLYQALGFVKHETNAYVMSL